MYGQSKTVQAKTFLFILLVSFLSAGLSFTSGAQSLIHQTQNSNEEVSVRYVGTEDDMMVYSVQFSNPSGTKYHLAISDNTGAVLFRDVFQVKQFDKKFKIPKEHTQLDFVVMHAGDKRRRKITVNDGSSIALAK
jgi:hypothetical protein